MHLLCICSVHFCLCMFSFYFKLLNSCLHCSSYVLIILYYKLIFGPHCMKIKGKYSTLLEDTCSTLNTTRTVLVCHWSHTYSSCLDSHLLLITDSPILLCLHTMLYYKVHAKGIYTCKYCLLSIHKS